MNCTKLYADDTKIVSKVDTLSEREALQTDLNTAYEWSKKWLVDFNLAKCVVMHYGVNNQKQEYMMGQTALGTTTCERDFGVIFSSDLKWKQHVLQCIAKANSMFCMIKNAFVNFDSKIVRTLYKIYVRPFIEFAAPV